MSKRALGFMVIGLVLAACSGGLTSHGGAAGTAAAGTQSAPESLTAAGEQELRAIVASGRLPDLQ